MDIIRRMDVKLSEKDIKEIVAWKINDEMPNLNVKPEDVDIEVSSRSVGYGASEYDEPYFKGVTVHCNKDKED